MSYFKGGVCVCGGEKVADGSLPERNGIESSEEEEVNKDLKQSGEYLKKASLTNTREMGS